LSDYPEEAPVHRVRVDGFWIDRHPVTNAQYAIFVSETGYETVAERPLDPADYPGAPEEVLVPGSLVFHGTPGPVPLDDPSHWWSYVAGAQWRRPLGPGSDAADVEDHPVVQVTYEDAETYAEWAGVSLPTEAEWEYAARGGLEGAAFTWGSEDVQEIGPLANTWQGGFPWQNSRLSAPAGLGRARRGHRKFRPFVKRGQTSRRLPKRDAEETGDCGDQHRAVHPRIAAEVGHDQRLRTRSVAHAAG